MEIENNRPAGLIFRWAGGVTRTIAELAAPDYVKP